MSDRQRGYTKIFKTLHGVTFGCAGAAVLPTEAFKDLILQQRCEISDRAEEKHSAGAACSLPPHSALLDGHGDTEHVPQ